MTEQKLNDRIIKNRLKLILLLNETAHAIQSSPTNILFGDNVRKECEKLRSTIEFVQRLAKDLL